MNIQYFLFKGIFLFCCSFFNADFFCELTNAIANQRFVVSILVNEYTYIHSYILHTAIRIFGISFIIFVWNMYMRHTYMYINQYSYIYSYLYTCMGCIQICWLIIIQATKNSMEHNHHEYEFIILI